MEVNAELREFLSQFGIDYIRCEEVMSYDLGEDKDSFIHSMAYYDVFGKIEKEFSMQKEDYTILFKERISALFRAEADVKPIPTRPDWDAVVKVMYDTGLDAFGDEVVKVIYSKDKSMRYVILKDEQSIFTYQLEAIYQYDDEEWQYICDSNEALPAMWEPHSNGWCGSRFNKIDDLMKALIYEPEYKRFFE